VRAYFEMALGYGLMSSQFFVVVKRFQCPKVVAVFDLAELIETFLGR
jgi:hypothetical protein